MPRQPPTAAIPSSVTTDNLPSSVGVGVSPFGTSVFGPYTANAPSTSLWDEPEEQEGSSGSSTEVVQQASASAAQAAAPQPQKPVMKDASTSTATFPKAITAPALDSAGFYQWQDNDAGGLLGSATSLGDVGDDDTLPAAVVSAPAHTKESSPFAGWPQPLISPYSMMGFPLMPSMIYHPMMLGQPLVNPHLNLDIASLMLNSQLPLNPLQQQQHQQQQKPGSPVATAAGGSQPLGAEAGEAAEGDAPKKRRRRRRHRGRGRRGRGKSKAAAAAAAAAGDESGGEPPLGGDDEETDEETLED
ncbi:hypothetical protein DIPPA_15591 [Diplonema papillatum]|nr:hypothetical protein DIPPA_15591 [Diplonema papillatum]